MGTFVAYVVHKKPVEMVTRPRLIAAIQKLSTYDRGQNLLRQTRTSRFFLHYRKI